MRIAQASTQSYKRDTRFNDAAAQNLLPPDPSTADIEIAHLAAISATARSTASSNLMDLPSRSSGMQVLLFAKVCAMLCLKGDKVEIVMGRAKYGHAKSWST